MLNNVQDRFDVNITELPDEIDLSSYSKLLNIFIIKTLEGLSSRVFVGIGQIDHTFTRLITSSFYKIKIVNNFIMLS